MGFWSRLLGTGQDNKYSAMEKRKALGREVAAADTKVWAIEDRLKDRRTTKQQRQDLLNALPKAKQRALVLHQKFEEARREEYAEDVRRTLDI